MLKENHGLGLIKEIPSVFLESFIKICALSNASSFEELKSFVDKIRRNIIEYWGNIDQDDFRSLLDGLAREL